MKAVILGATVAVVVAGTIFFARSPPRQTCIENDFLTSPIACGYKGETAK